MSTPESKIKDMVRKVLAEFAGEEITIDGLRTYRLYQFWPVPSGFGASSLDCIACYYGMAIYIETKAPGAKPTPRQGLTIIQIRGAGGKAFVIDGEEGCRELRTHLLQIRFRNTKVAVDANNC